MWKLFLWETAFFCGTEDKYTECLLLESFRLWLQPHRRFCMWVGGHTPLLASLLHDGSLLGRPLLFRAWGRRSHGWLTAGSAAICLSSPTPQLGNLSLRWPGCWCTFWSVLVLWYFLPHARPAPTSEPFPGITARVGPRILRGPVCPAPPSSSLPGSDRRLLPCGLLTFFPAFPELTLVGGGLGAVLPGMIMCINF